MPAWVVGSLTHSALRHWLFPDDDDFADFIKPFALEAGLTDPTSIRTALGRAGRLLTRFQGHALYAEMAPPRSTLPHDPGRPAAQRADRPPVPSRA